MPQLPSIPQSLAYLILRITMGIILCSHGLARLYYNSVGDFGAYLDGKGLYFGVIIAWVITIGEIISGLLLALGYLVRYAVIFHAVIILSGILMLHLWNGWFVVGHGQGGMEYSVLILVVLVFIYSKAK